MESVKEIRCNNERLAMYLVMNGALLLRTEEDKNRKTVFVFVEDNIFRDIIKDFRKNTRRFMY